MKFYILIFLASMANASVCWYLVMSFKRHRQMKTSFPFRWWCPEDECSMNIKANCEDVLDRFKAIHASSHEKPKV